MANNRTKNDCECGVWINKSDIIRFELWQRVLEQERPFIYIKSLVPEMSKYGAVYRGDPERLTKKQWKNLVNAMSKKFNLPKRMISSDLKKGEFPIIQDDTTISVGKCHIGLLM